MRDEDFNIHSFGEFITEKTEDGQAVLDFFRPSVTTGFSTVDMTPHEVAPHEEGRIDLIMDSVYNSLPYSYPNIDIILYLNGIDNPLAIMAGDVLMFPPSDFFGDFRYVAKTDMIDKARRDRTLGVLSGEPNKSTRVDPKRTKYLESVAFPPTITQNPQVGVVLDNKQIKIGGIG